MAPPTTDFRKKARSIMATDSEWKIITRRAHTAGLSISQFVLSRTIEPITAAPRDEELPLSVRRQAAVDLRTLALAERARFRQAGADDSWTALVREADKSITLEEEVG